MECLLKIFGLDHIQDSRIGDFERRGISGGERKRVSICSELIVSPRVLFLDEPTTGLDSYNAQIVCECLKEVAQRDRIAMLITIHQPKHDLLRLFDSIILLAEGSIIFSGSVDEALQHFSNLGFECPEETNPGEFFLDLMTINHQSSMEVQQSRARIDRLISAWQSPTIHSTPPLPPLPVQDSSKYPVSASRQLNLLLQRHFTVMFRNHVLVIAEVVSTIAIALLLGFVYFQLRDDFGGVQDRLGLLFLKSTIISIVMSLLPIFVLDQLIMRKELYNSSYRLSTAYTARFLALLPSRLILYTIFAAILYYIAGLRTDGFQYFLIFWAFVMDLVFACISLGLLIASCVRTVYMGQIIGAFVILFALLFGGNLANPNSITWILRWLQYLSIVFYAYEGLIQNELHGNTFDGVPGDFYLEQYGLNQVPIVVCAMALLGLGALFLLSGYVALGFSTKPKLLLNVKPTPPAIP